MRCVLALLAAGLLCVQAAADEIDLSFSGDALRVVYLHDLTNSRLNVEGGWLENGDYGRALHVGLTLRGFASGGANPVRAGVGGRLAVVDGDLANQSGYGFGMGGFLSYTLTRFNRITLTGAAYFAPDILTGSDLEKYQDYTARLGYQIMWDAEIYLGVRYVKGDFNATSKVLFDDGVHIGFSIRF